jgi:hypothetical protein
MKKTTTFRTLKKEVSQILLLDNREKALAQFQTLPEERMAGPLFSHFYSMKDVVRFRSTSLMGEYAAGLEKKSIEKSRIILRRLMWNLNDESGGIGWGSCEAMGEILSRSQKLAKEFGSILFSYLDPNGNYLEHDMLQRGLLWGVGTFLESGANPGQETLGFVKCFLDSPDLIKQGYAVRAMAHSTCSGCEPLPDHFMKDVRTLLVFDGWHMKKMAIADLAQKRKPA